MRPADTCPAETALGAQRWQALWRPQKARWISSVSPMMDASAIEWRNVFIDHVVACGLRVWTGLWYRHLRYRLNGQLLYLMKPAEIAL